MRRGCLVLVVFCVLGILLGSVGCTVVDGDPLACFRQGFFAEVKGELGGVALEATLEAEPAGEGKRAVTVTVYAPAGLSGTVLRREADGTVRLCAGDVTAQPNAGAGFYALFDLFPVAAEVTGVSLDQNGHTVVNFAGGTVTLLPDGTPFAITTSAAGLRVVSFVPQVAQ